MDENLQRLVNICYNVIAEEGLPRPKFINFRASLNGVRKRLGCCSKYVENNGRTAYKIIINTTSARYVKCDEGKYIDRKTGIKYRRGIGEKIPFHKILEYTAHEIAHLKYWKHNAQHKSYTIHILNVLKQRLGILEGKTNGN